MSEQGSHSEPQARLCRTVRRDAPLASLFRRHTHRYSTRTSEGFIATLQEDGQEILLWLLRFPLSAGSPEDERFISRIEKLIPFFPKDAIHSCGVDDRGIAFCAIRMEAYDPVVSLSMPLSQRIIAWKSIVELVARLHQLGVCLGDISEDSFVWHPDHGVQLIGVMGTFDAAGSATAMLPPQDTLRFLAPEQRGVFVSEPVFDVYSLGVYAYKFFASAYPIARQSKDGATGQVPIEIGILQPELPDWLSDIIGICLQGDPDKRYYSAPELLEAFEAQGVGTSASSRVSIWARQTAELSERILLAARPQSVAESDSALRNSSVFAQPSSRYESSVRGRYQRVLEISKRCLRDTRILLVGTGILVACLIFGFWALLGAENIEPYSQAHRSYVPPELEQPLAVISNRSRSLAERAEAIEELANIENQFVFPILATLVQGAFDERIREEALLALSGNIRRSGMPNVALLFEKSLQVEKYSLQDTENPNSFLSMVRAADAMQTMDARLTALEQAYSSHPAEAIAIAAALAVDSGGSEQLALLRSLLLRHSGTLCLSADTCHTRRRVRELIPQLDLSALLLSHSSTVPLFSREQLESLWLESPETQAYVLEYLFFNRPDLFAAAMDLGVEQGGVGSLAGELLREFRRHQDEIDRALAISILRSIVGVVGDEDIYRFTRWSSEEASSLLILMAGILTERNHPKAIDVFDAASSKSRKTVAEQALLDFVRSEAWSQRGKLIFPVCVLLHPDLFPVETVAFAFDSFEPYSARLLFDTLLKTKIAKTIRFGLQRLRSQLPSQQVIPLLQHEDAEVRMEAIRSLAGRNDISVLQGILSAYDSEQNPEVRMVYQQLHWVTKGR